MKNAVENVALLYLMNQNTKSMSLDELYQLYADTVESVKKCQERRLQADVVKNGPLVSTGSQE